jgi:protein SCO1
VKKSIWLFLLSLAVLVAVGFMTVQSVKNAQPLPVYAEHTNPEFRLLNQKDDTVSSEVLQNKIWIVNSFFTSCPSICPTMMRHLKTVNDIYYKDSAVQFLSFTVDPKRDTPQRLSTFAAAYQINTANWQLLTGDKLTIYKLLRKGFLLGATDGGEDTDFVHSENIILMDSHRRIRGIYRGTDAASVRQLKKDIIKLKKEKS